MNLQQSSKPCVNDEGSGVQDCVMTIKNILMFISNQFVFVHSHKSNNAAFHEEKHFKLALSLPHIYCDLQEPHARK